MSRVYMTHPARVPSSRTSSRRAGAVRRQPATGVPGAVMVEANRPWTDAGITVRRGDRVAIRTSGTIKWERRR
jgi:hypothetical protein